MTGRKVPLSISIITILMYVGAVLDIAAGLFMIIDKDNLAEAAGSDFSSSVFLYYGIALIAFGVIIGLLARSLHSGGNGARLIVAVVMGLRLVTMIYAAFAMPAVRFEAIGTGIVAAVVLYFLYGTDDAKAFFS